MTRWDVRCSKCRKIVATTPIGTYRVVATHLDVGVYCGGSRVRATTDADVVAVVRTGR